MAIKDDELIRLYYIKNPSAKQITKNKYHLYCKSIAKNMIFDSKKIEACLDETNQVVWNSIPPYIPLVFKNYLGKITRNIAFKYYEKQNIVQKVKTELYQILNELDECVSSNSNQDHIIDEIIMQNYLNDFLNTLTTFQGALFVRRYWYVESINAISVRYGISEFSIKINLKIIRKRLYYYLLERGID